ncbi:glycosyl transferase [Oenococcus oeni S25]|uniref:glycosyltransferase n=1 Tax=Oenococcus oeni TaxID=1247 RepID=UPI00050FD713|nr:glycosyltransferase [Oenococcus oeni]KGH55945.1 glycosyl transferase [Oenococcus oeni S22]KGH70567.1 glycosyl transferase [Oenococcus oeni S25]KGH79964.1 glycosyl transferase [Oenococcus oeni IOEB_0607]KGH88632.1 glycosyl transferase [Oenococcus oeni IOEB_L26_1]KMQ38665.1 glycosyl transferase [Oenococcus oeni]
MKLTSTVIMAAFNGSKYIYDQLDSIANQKLKPTKVIIRDDCSTDDTETIVKNFIFEHDLQNSWDFQVNPERKGWRDNFMDMVDQTNTDIVFFADQDDIWNKNKISESMKCFSENDDMEVFVSDYNFLPADQKILPKDKIDEVGDGDVGQVIPDLHNLIIRRDGCSMAFKKSIIGPLEEVYSGIRSDSNGLDQAHDQATWLAGLMRESLYHVNQPLMVHRAHLDSTWQTVRKNNRSLFVGLPEEGPNYIVFLKSIQNFLLHSYSYSRFSKQAQQKLEKVIAEEIDLLANPV